jgi:hypothetical protein
MPSRSLEAARSFRPMTPAQIKTLLAKTEKAARGGEFELFNTTSLFDSTAKNPAWLGEEPERLQQLAPAG